LTEQYIIDSFDENIICGTEDETPLRVIQVNLSDSNLDRCGIVRSISHPLATEARTKRPISWYGYFEILSDICFTFGTNATCRYPQEI
jgi:hypothetical protein